MELQAEIQQEPRKSRKFIIIRNAVLLVIVLIAILLATHHFGENTNITITQIAIFEYALLLVSVLITQLEVRNKIFNGIMDFSFAFSTGMIFIVIVTALFPIFTLIFYKFIAPELLDEMLVIAENSLIEQGYNAEDVDERMTFTRRIFTPGGMFVVSLIGYLFFGIIMALIASIFTQRSK